MKLICLTGSLRGREFRAAAGGLGIGRARDNDVVLTDDSEVSRYHAKVELVGTEWQLRDRESSNGVFLNGRKLTRSMRLANQDEIRIGCTLFRVLTEEADTETPIVTIKAAEPASESPGFEGATPEPAPSAAEPPPPALPPAAGGAAAPSRRRALALAAILLLVALVIVTGIVLKNSGTPRKADLDLSARPSGPKDLRIYYEKVEASPTVVFRFELSIRNGEMRLVVDDVVNDRRVEEERQLRDDQLEILTRSLLTKEFLALAPVPPETRQGGLSRVELLVQFRERGNDICLENSAPSPAFAAVVQSLMSFVQGELGVFSEPVPREEALRLAAEEYANARRLHEERSVDPANLYRAVKAYRQVLERLKRFDDKPDWFAAATAELQAAQTTLDDELSQLLRNALTAKTAGNLDEARRLLETIVGMVPDRDHEIARKARSEMIAVNQLIQQRQRKR